jgi:dephospho-CoA kinase
MKRIALIGLRGAGKSTLGALLAKQLGVPFVELDREIEREGDRPLRDLSAVRPARLPALRTAVPRKCSESAIGA